MSSLDKLLPEFRVVEGLSVGSMEDRKSKKLAARAELSDDEECDKEDEGHKEDEVGAFETPLKKIEAQKSPQKRLRIPKK